jgi:cellulose synthase operon protein YhjQ
MTDLNPLTDPTDQTGTPEDVATLYSWANLHGAKYRDFSAARAQTREKARLRAEQAAEEQLRQSHAETDAEQQADAERLAEQTSAAETAHQADLAQEDLAAEHARHEAEYAAQLAAHETADRAAREAAELAAQQAATQAAENAARLQAEEAQIKAQREAAGIAARQAEELAAQQAAEQAARTAAQSAAQAAAAQEAANQDAADQAEAQRAALRAQELAAHLIERRAAQEAAQLAAREAAEQAAERFAAAPASTPAAPYFPQHAQNYDTPSYARPHAFRPAQGQPHYTQPREENNGPRNPWTTPEMREPAGRPAWLTPDQTETPSSAGPFAPSQSQAPQPPSSLPQAPEDTLQGSRDRLTSRWFALRGVFDGTVPAPVEAVPPPVTSHAPAMAVFSLAGGVGKTSLVATLGRALSARGERVLLVDTAAFGLLPFFFGATDQRPGILRTFNPPGVSSDAPVQMVTIDPDTIAIEISSQESLGGEITKFARGASRIIIDLATASGATTRRIMRMSPLVLVPVIPDMNSVVSVSSIDAFFEHSSNPAARATLPYYVLNQFDASLPLHLDVREVLREQLGERLLPFALRRTPAISEALAEGMTVMDYAPGSALAEDFVALAGWIKGLSAPATTSYRGVRWSER